MIAWNPCIFAQADIAFGRNNRSIDLNVNTNAS
jgi:hypothetical protein